MTPITHPFYKKVNDITDVDELRDYVTYLQSEVFNLIDAYNELSETYNDLLHKHIEDSTT